MGARDRRRGGRSSTAQPALSVAAGAVEVELPFDGDALLAYLSLRTIAGVEKVADGIYTRVLDLGDAPALVEVDIAGATTSGEARIATDADTERLPEIGRLVERLIDGSWNPAAAIESLGSDPALGTLVEKRPGLRIPGTMAPFEIAVRAIVGQQISVAGATTLTARLVERFGTPLTTNHPGLTHRFPTPIDLAQAPLEEVGLPAIRSGAIRGLAEALATGNLSLAYGDAASMNRLQEIRGIGPWTAAYVGLRGLGLRDAIPVSDLGLRQALGRDGQALPAITVEDRAEAWRPLRGVAAAHLWTALILD